MKTFSQWTTEEVELEFGLAPSRNAPILQKWLTVPAHDSGGISDSDKMCLQTLSQKLLNRVHDWNEEELKVYFVANLLNMIDFDQGIYRPFLERELSAKYAENKQLSGTIDFLIAQGKQTPRQSFFFIKEYKRERHSSKDPLGQLLAEMVAAQFLNEQAQPIYGAYIVGRYWYFVVLDGKTYAESLSYDATKDEVIDIFNILCNTKTIIDQMVAKLQGCKVAA